MTTYGHTYNRGLVLSDNEIYQIQVAKEEILAELKKAVVNFYRDENTGEVLTICQTCFKAEDLQDFHGHLTYIDKAASWDECRYCDAQNVPSNYHGKI